MAYTCTMQIDILFALQAHSKLTWFQKSLRVLLAQIISIFFQNLCCLSSMTITGFDSLFYLRLGAMGETPVQMKNYGNGAIHGR